MRRTNFAPTAATIAVALVLIALGLVGSTGRFVPAAWGAVAYVMAEVLLIVGCATRRL